MSKPYWTPLESNPEVLTKFIHNIGVSSAFQFHDMFSLDEEMLSFVPQPCLAVILLFPYEEMKKFKAEERAEIEKSGQTISPKVFYMKQLIGNACGTVAVMHALGNNQSVLAPGADTIIARFWEQTKSMDHMARGQALADSHELASAHHVVAKEGQTDAPEADANVNYHFISFVQVDGSIYELDGGKQFPINHGPSSADTFIADAVKVIKTNFVEKLGQDFNFSVVTLGPAVDE